MATKTRQNLSRFITTEAIPPNDHDSYQKVWDAVKSAFSSRKSSIGYWRYPLFLQVGDRRKEPDILVVDQEWGIIAIEVCTAKIEQITSVNNNYIDFSDERFKENYSLSNISKYVQILRTYCDQEPIRGSESDIQNKVIGRTLIAFPYISTEEWHKKGFSGTEEGLPFLFNNQMGEAGLRSRIEKAKFTIEGQSLNDSQYRTLLTVVSGNSILRKPLKTINSSDSQSRYNILVEAQKLMYEWDVKQEWVGKSIPPGPQRVRGIAGSGKTVLFSQKAVIMHLKHPEWKVAFVFFTRSLYDQIEKLFELWIERFTNGEIQYKNDPNSNLRVFHAWGAQERDGLYGEICKIEGVTKLKPFDKQRSPNDNLAYGCRNFLVIKPKFNPVFDALIIDEGQDLISEDDLKFTSENGEKKQAIYWLAYQSLKSVSEDDPTQKRLIWAYDEAQTIHSQGAVVPEAKEVFGKELSSLIGGRGGGIYLGDIRKAYDMECCYRTPGDILMVAYALGVGLLRTQGILKPERMRKKDLQAIGFDVVEGDFRKTNTSITITRPQENSPNPVSSIFKNSVIKLETYDSREDELSALVQKIKSNINQDFLKPSRNILVITLGYTTPPSYDGNNLQKEVFNFLIEHGINTYIPAALKLNVLPKSSQENPDLFWHDGGVTVSRIDRTKGNEADMVYLVGLDNIAKNESDTKLRNQLFVALTRSRGWVNISGMGDYPLYKEVHEAIKQRNTFTFTLKGVKASEDANDDFTEEDEQNL